MLYILCILEVHCFPAPRTFDSWACASKMPTPLACPVIPQFCWRPSCVAQSRSPKKFVGQKPPVLPGVKNSHTWEWGLLITPDSGNSSNVGNLIVNLQRFRPPIHGDFRDGFLLSLPVRDKLAHPMWNNHTLMRCVKLRQMSKQRKYPNLH